MKKGLFNNKGSLLIEVLLAGTLLSILITTFIGAILHTQETSAVNSKYTQAVFLAEEGLEATINIRDNNFINLTNGNHGLSINKNQWKYNNTSDITDNFTRTINISNIDNYTKKIVSNITWDQNLQRTGSISLITYLTDWKRQESLHADYISVDIDDVKLNNNKKILQKIYMKNIGDFDIILDKIIISWQNNSQIKEIRLDNKKIWSKSGPGNPSGKQSSSTEIDVKNFVLSVGLEFELNKIKFTKKMKNQTFSIDFIFTDGSNLLITDITP